MKLKFKDMNGNYIDTDCRYKDTNAGVTDIYLSIINDTWYAIPNGLDGEPLSKVCKNLELDDSPRMSSVELYRQDYTDETWDEICKNTGVTDSKVLSITIPFDMDNIKTWKY